MGSAYEQRVRDTLVPRSTIGAKTAREAAKEWALVPSSREGSGTCQLCGHTGYRYSYKIQHKVTGEELLIGSICYSNYWGVQPPPPKRLVLKRPEPKAAPL